MSESTSTLLVPRFQVLINGSDLGMALQQDIFSLSVLQDVEAPGMFSIRVNIWDINKEIFTWVDDDRLSEGNEIEIKLGYNDELVSIFIGDITALEPEYSYNDVPQMVVRGYDQRYRLMRGVKTRSFSQVTDAEIVSSIGSDLGLNIAVEDPAIRYEYVLQNNQSDFDFLKERADLIGYELVIEDNTLYFRPRAHSVSSVLTLNRTKDLIEFNPRLTALKQVSEFSVRAWDPKTKSSIVARSAVGDEVGLMAGEQSGPDKSLAGLGGAINSVVNFPVFSQEEADAIALSRFNESALRYVEGEGLIKGRNDLVAGSVIHIEGLGTRFSGDYYVTSVRHSYLPRKGYQTSFKVRRNAA